MTDFSGHSKRYSSGYRVVLSCQLNLKLELKWFLENEDYFIIIIILIFGNCFELKCVSSIVFGKLLQISWYGLELVNILCLHRKMIHISSLFPLCPALCGYHRVFLACSKISSAWHKFPSSHSTLCYIWCVEEWMCKSYVTLPAIVLSFLMAGVMHESPLLLLRA